MSPSSERRLPESSASGRAGISDRRADLCRGVGFFFAAGGALVHALTALTPFPGWELDPFVAPVPHTGLGPGGSMLTDVVIRLGVVIILIGEWAKGRRLIPWALILWVLGSAGVLASGVGEGRDPHIASAWTAAISLGVAMAHLCRDDRYKRMVLAVLGGLVIMLAVRGAQQVIIEHPQTMQEYRQNRERFLDAQGWTHDSPMAKSYERRISQNEASGWFGLANVYATFAAGGATAGAVLVVSLALARRRHARDTGADGPGPSFLSLSWLFALPAAGIAALVLADAKGGLAAAVLGVGFAGLVAMLCSRRARLIDRLGRLRTGAILSVGTLAATVSLVVVRGVLGTGLSELSLLFRWFYLDAAARIGLRLFPLGCGADGFKTMYSLLKNPLSPENVSSSHNLLADYWACAGLSGVAWIALWIGWIARAGVEAAGAVSPAEMSDASPQPQDRRTAQNRADSEQGDDTLDFRIVAGIGVVATLLALRLETPIMTPDLALVRVIGLLAWCGSAWLVTSGRAGMRELLTGGAVRFALAAAAVAMGAHSLIDQAGVWPPSASMLMLLVGGAAAGRLRAGSPRDRVWCFIIALWVLIPTSSSRISAWTMFRWERQMIRAAEVAHPAAEISIAWQNLSSPRAVSRSEIMAQQKDLREQLSRLIGRTVKDSPDAVQAVIEAVVVDRLRTAISELNQAQSIRPGHLKTQRELSRLELALGQRLWLAGDRQQGKEHLDRALTIATRGLLTDPDAAPARNEDATYDGWAAVVCQARYELTQDPSELRVGIPYLERATKLDPYGLEFPKRLMLLHEALGDTPQAARWARKALELDDLQRLDQQVQGLRESERAEALRLTTHP